MNQPGDGQRKIDRMREALAECSVRDRLRLGRRLQKARKLSREEIENLERRIERSREWVRRQKQGLPAVRYPEDLPVAERREEIVGALQHNRCIVVAGETGSGKTTQLPKMCLEAGLGAAGRIACTQPRRVAALSVSRRIAEELDVAWGAEVGCKIRFSDKTASNTRIKMMTDGMLLGEIQGDPDLSEYEAVIVDEAHERSLNIDFLLGHLRLLRERRPDLRIIISSATIDPEAFSRAFDNAPVVEVSGRMFPVEVRYRPVESFPGQDEDPTYIEAAAASVEEIVTGQPPGDILVFFPGERDIREAKDLLDGRRLRGCEVLPLFGRLSQVEQHRIFEPIQRRKIILATNVAETSITIPGIRYVVDTGLARISRFSPHTRTQRLPVEPISRSSADQRKGRCGRVAEGVCYRLYAEYEYDARPRFQTPEILRSNLAGVILRMKAFRIGEPETFPFLDPPAERAIKVGYGLLRDLGAVNDKWELSGLGRQLARLPVDPTVGRMLLQSRREHAMTEVMVIAAGLSAQDPRERPMEKREAADAVHRRFVSRESDFLTLLNIWNAYHDECERLSLGQLRKFCKKHFLSFTRMREWRDTYNQLIQTLKEMGEFRERGMEAEYDAIHRSILAGLLSNVARKDEGNAYRATHNRKPVIFPGSGLHDRKADNAAKRKKEQKKQVSSRSPEWIVAAEWVETSRLFARQVAGIKPEWILELGKHLLKSSVGEPFWSRKAGRVVARERLLLYGLEISERRIGYGRVDPEHASEIFIRSALVEGEVEENFPFLEANRHVCERVQGLQTRLRRSLVWSLEDRLFEFYRQRLPPISSIAELNKVIRDDSGNDPDFLRLTEADLLEDSTQGETATRFPEEVDVGGQRLALSYAYRPGTEEDGVTLRVPLEQLDAVRPGVLDWMVPGHLEEKITALLRALPKETRKQLIPIPDKVRELLTVLEPSSHPLTEVLAEAIRERFGVTVRPGDWNMEAVPEHLRPRVEVIDRKARVLTASRDWKAVKSQYQERVRQAIREGGGASGTPAWREAAAQWERDGLKSWSFGDLPEKLRVGEAAGVPLEGYPGLQYEGETVSVRLFQDRADAERSSRRGLRFLYEQEIGRDLAWLKKNLRDMRKLKPLMATIPLQGDPEEAAYDMLCEWLFFDGETSVLPLTEKRFRQKAAEAAQQLNGLGPRFIDLLEEILAMRQKILTGKHATGLGQAEVNRLIGPNLLDTPFARLRHYPRYLRAIELRVQRAEADPQKDAGKAAAIERFERRFNAAVKVSATDGHSQEGMEELRSILEEFRVSVFAQELGTAVRVSEKKLEEKFRTIENSYG